MSGLQNPAIITGWTKSWSGWICLWTSRGVCVLLVL